MVCFVTDLLWRIIVSSTVNLFVGFRVSSSDDKVQSDKVIRSNYVHQYAADLES